MGHKVFDPNSHNLFALTQGCTNYEAWNSNQSGRCLNISFQEIQVRLISLERGSFPSGACQYYYSAIISFFPGIFLQSVLVHYWVLFSTNSQLFSPDFLSFSLMYLSFPSFVPSCIFVLFLFSLCSPFSLSVLNYPSPFQFYPLFPLCERGIPIFIPKFSSYGTLIRSKSVV